MQMSSHEKFLYTKIKKQLIKDFTNNGPNERIPPRNELAEKYSVSRTTIERAISELIAAGFLYSKGGSGTYISQQKQHAVATGIQSWGVILPNILLHMYSEVVRGVEDIANQHNINLIICNTDNQIEKQSQYIQKLIHSHVRGMIIIPALEGNIDFESYEWLHREGIPFVFCNRYDQGVDVPCVLTNDFFGAFIAARHLVDNGYAKIGFISKTRYSNSIERYKGYLSCLSYFGRPVNKDHIIFEHELEHKDQGYQSALQLLSRSDKPDAIVCHSDNVAQGVFRACEELNLQVGKEVGLVGYYDTSISESLRVRLTSVNLQSRYMGAAAAQLLVSPGGPALPIHEKMIVVQPELVVRDSSARR